jgi:hypothetical protein
MVNAVPKGTLRAKSSLQSNYYRRNFENPAPTLDRLVRDAIVFEETIEVGGLVRFPSMRCDTPKEVPDKWIDVGGRTAVCVTALLVDVDPNGEVAILQARLWGK